MTKEQWAKVEAAMAGTYGHAELIADGFKVSLVRRQVSKNQLGTVVYLWGKMKGKWLLDEESEYARRFARKIVKPAHNAKQRKEIARLKRMFPEDKYKGTFWDPDAKITTLWHYWFSFPAMRRHFEANNESIQLVHVNWEYEPGMKPEEEKEERHA